MLDTADGLDSSSFRARRFEEEKQPLGVAVIHTYRDAKVLDSWAPQRADVVSGLAVVLILAWLIMVGLKTGVPSGVWAQGLVAVGLTCGAASFFGRRYELRRCGEIRLDDKAGTCELGTMQAVITLHVSEISSVEYETDGDMSYEYRVRHQGGAVPVEKGMVDFSDFLARLKSLNPDVEFRHIPARVWPGSGTTRTRAADSDVGRRFAATAFPIAVVVLLAWLAFATLKPR